MRKYKILIVEDEVLVRGGLKAMIDWEKLGLELAGDAANGAEALEIYRECRPDIILTDIRMPVMDGLELTASIRHEDQQTKIIFLTCYEDFTYLQEAMRLGVSDYILKLKMKPDEIEQVLKKVCRQLDQERKDPEYSTAKNEAMKEDIFKQYIFYRRASEENFKSWEKKLDFQVKERNLVMCRMLFLNYEQVKEQMKDPQGALIKFLVNNMIEELAGSLKGAEIVWEAQEKLLLLVNVEQTEEEMRKLQGVLRKITRTFEESMKAKAKWGVSSAADSWEMLPVLYQECRQKMEAPKEATERIKAETDGYEPTEKKEEAARYITEEETRRGTKQISVEIYKAMEYIDAHLTEKLTLNQVAEYIALSPNYFSSLWKKELKIGFVDYIAEKRIEKAVELFRTTDLRTHEVAEKTGFVDDSYFSKTFKKVTGQRPSSFRKRELTE